jgi:hypothetical protein
VIRFPEGIGMKGTRRFLFSTTTVAFLLSLFAFFVIAGSKQIATHPEANLVQCRVLESHASKQPAAGFVVFHQRDKQDQPRLSTLLQQHSGTVVDLRADGGNWQSATVVRLKSCFGRGLLVLPSGAPMPEDGGTFLLRFPAGDGGQR